MAWVACQWLWLLFQMVSQLNSLKPASVGYPVAKSPSFGGHMKNIPQVCCML